MLIMVSSDYKGQSLEIQAQICTSSFLVRYGRGVQGPHNRAVAGLKDHLST